MTTEHQNGSTEVDDTWTEVAEFSFDEDENVARLVCQTWVPAANSGTYQVIVQARSSIGGEVPPAAWQNRAKFPTIKPADDADPENERAESATYERKNFAYDDLRVMARRVDGPTAAETIYTRCNAKLED